MDRVAHGAIGIIRAAGHVVGIHSVPLDALSARAGKCLACDRGGKGWFCKECGCIVAAKIRNLAERCPLGKWEAVETDEVKNA